MSQRQAREDEMGTAMAAMAGQGAGCVEPGRVAPEELMAYADGDAPPRVVEHVRRCPSCAAAAGGFRQAQRQLRRVLYRFECPPAHTLGDYDLGLVSPEERTQIAAHVLDCPRCTAELQALRSFLADEPRRTAPPEGAGARLRRVVATLLAPRDLGYAALRGGDTETGTYRAGDLSITVAPAPGARRGVYDVAGLALRDAGGFDTLVGREVRLVDRTGQTLATQVDALGNFFFEDVTPGTYGLEVELDDQVVVVEDLRVAEDEA